MSDRTGDVYVPRPNSLFLPATFEERGTLAPFTTPALLASRVRPDERHGMVLLVPSFGGTDGCYVVPWKSVPEIVSMTVHDRALYDDIVENKAITPDAMRVSGLRVAATGLAGPQAKLGAEATLEADASQKTETHFFLILRLLQMLGIDHRAMLSMDPRTGAWRAATTSMLAEAATLLNVHIDEVYSRLEEISTLLTPIGILALKQSGRLRKLVAGLVDMRDSAGESSTDASPEAAELYRFAATVEQDTIDIAERLLIRIDAAVMNVPRIVSDWKVQRSQVERLIDRLSWLLDGWDLAVGAWSQLRDLNGAERLVQLACFARMLPLVPRKEAESEEEAGRRQLHKAHQTRRIKGLEDWRSGQIDAELIRRLETARTRSVGSGRTVAA